MDQDNEPSGIKFEEDKWSLADRTSYAKKTGMIEWVIKYSGGLIKDEKKAQYVLLGFTALIITISLFFISNSRSSSTSNNESPIYQEDLTPTARETIPEDILKTIPYRI